MKVKEKGWRLSWAHVEIRANGKELRGKCKELEKKKISLSEADKVNWNTQQSIFEQQSYFSLWKEQGMLFVWTPSSMRENLLISLKM